MKQYSLEPVSIGEDSYVVLSRGHHDIHVFMGEVRKHWDWPLGTPEHLWMKTMPAREDGYSHWYQPVAEGTRGAWPCTYVSEAHGEERYEGVFREVLAAGTAPRSEGLVAGPEYLHNSAPS